MNKLSAGWPHTVIPFSIAPSIVPTYFGTDLVRKAARLKGRV